MRLGLRLVTVIFYFLPCIFFFATCNNGLELRFAYNQQEADRDILDQRKGKVTETNADSVQSSVPRMKCAGVIVNRAKDSLSYSNEIISDNTTNESNFRDRFFKKIIMPTESSLSGIGIILYFKNVMGKIVMGLCLVISLTLLIAFKLIKSIKLTQYLLSSAICCLVIFIADSFMSDVTLLYGTWMLVLILLLQLYIEPKNETVDG